MKPKDLVRGRKYKFDNKLFKSECPGCYGIDDIDSEFLFNSEIITLTDFCWHYEDRYTEVFSDIEIKDKESFNPYFAFYIKGFRSFNFSIEESTGRKMWYTSKGIDFLKYLEKIDNIIQEEFDV